MDLRRIGVIIGSKKIALLLLRELRRRRVELVGVSIAGRLSKEAKRYLEVLYSFSPGELKKVIETFQRERVEGVILIGKIDKQVLFSQEIKLDRAARVLLKRLKTLDDFSVMRAVVDEFERRGLKVLKQSSFLSKFLLKKGVLTRTRPNKEEWKDIKYGFLLAKEVARLGIGQTVVVKHRTPLAIEAIEGTDECIKRAGRFFKGAVVVKVGWPLEDRRFDMPTVGVETLKVMIKTGIKILAIEANESLVIDREELIKKADESGISIVAV